MAVALVWTVWLGSQAVRQVPATHVERLSPAHIARQRVRGEVVQQQTPRLSYAQRGRLVLLASLVRAEDWPMGAIMSAPGPDHVTPLKRVVKATKL